MSLSFSGFVAVLKNVENVFYIGFIETDIVVQDGPVPHPDPRFNIDVTKFSSNVKAVEFQDMGKIKDYFQQHRSDILEHEVQPLKNILTVDYDLVGQPLLLELQTSTINGICQVGVGVGKIIEFVQAERVMFQPNLVVERVNTNQRMMHDPQVGRPS